MTLSPLGTNWGAQMLTREDQIQAPGLGGQQSLVLGAQCALVPCISCPLSQEPRHNRAGREAHEPTHTTVHTEVTLVRVVA